MARLASQAKAGYYPLPPGATERLAQRYTTYAGRGKVLRLLDPCCGEGQALETIKKRLNSTRTITYGVELHRERAAEAARRLDHVLYGDLFNCIIAHDVFSFLLLNPPYDSDESEDGKSKRRETSFLQRCTPYLATGGGLALVVPESTLNQGELIRHLLTRYSGLERVEFPDDEREQFSQVMILGTKRGTPARVKDVDVRHEHTRLTTPESRNTGGYRYSLVLRGETSGDVLFASRGFMAEEASEEASRQGVWKNRALAGLWSEDIEPVIRRPLLPLRLGHVSLLTAAGLLNNMELEKDGRRILIKGRTWKEYEVTDDGPQERVRRERLRAKVITLDLESGVFEELHA